MDGVYYDWKGNLIGIHSEMGEHMSEKNCGHCAYHKKDSKKKEWMCVNERSDSCGEYTAFTERCPGFEGREDDGYVTRPYVKKHKK